MNAKLRIGSLVGLALASCLAPRTAPAQTMSATVHYQTVPGFQNIYLASFPYARPFDDIADSRMPGNHCVDDVLLGDGIINADDIICRVWGDGDPAKRVGAFWIEKFDEATCQFAYRVATRTAFGILFGGDPWDFDPDIGYWIQLVPPRGGTQDFTVTYVDDCAPVFTGRMIQPPMSGCAPKNMFLHVPYNSALRTANEVLCGVEGVDWVDADSDGWPDTCTRGIFDGAHTISVLTFDNIDDDSTVTSDNAFTSRTASFSFGRVRHAGSNFPLHEGESYVVSMWPTQTPTAWDPATGACN